MRNDPFIRLAVALLSSGAVQVAPAANSMDDIFTSPHLLGDWGGVRTHLSEEGVDWDFGYETESAHNFTGGTQRLTRYTDQLKAGMSFDLDKLWSWQGALLNVVVTDRNGENLGADAHIGNNQLIQEVYGRGQTWHLTDLTLQQQWLSGRVSIKAGRLPVGEDFASFSCDFENLTFCGAPVGNIAGSYWVNWPTSLWAAVAKLKLMSTIYIQLGGYQVNPNYVNDRYAKENGLLPTFPGGTTGALLPIEVGWSTVLNGLPGNYKWGAWYNTSKSADLYWDVNREPIAITGAAALEHKGTFGGYINFEQQVSGVLGGAGANVFLNVTQADKDTTATDGQIALGVEYKGSRQRPDDMVGFALGATHANSRYGDYQRLYNAVHPGASFTVDDGYEYVGELFYSWSPIKSLVLRPNVQYVLHPGGSTHNSNALILGLKTGIAF